jgi:hypothetical protein
LRASIATRTFETPPTSGTAIANQIALIVTAEVLMRTPAIHN